MHLRLPTFTSILLALAPFTQACQPPTNASDSFELGNDGPADPATVGYSVNHMALLVNNLTASMHFYQKVLGMRHVFTFHATPTYDVVYLSHSQGGSNGTGFQTGEALFAQKSNTEGQLELIYNKRERKLSATTQRSNTFSHIGLIVPDILAVQKRMEQFGVTILKRTGEEFRRGGNEEVQGSRAFGFGEDVQAAREAVLKLSAFGFEYFLVVVDPDGNVLEIQPQA